MYLSMAGRKGWIEKRTGRVALWDQQRNHLGEKPDYTQTFSLLNRWDTVEESPPQMYSCIQVGYKVRKAQRKSAENTQRRVNRKVGKKKLQLYITSVLKAPLRLTATEFIYKSKAEFWYCFECVFSISLKCPHLLMYINLCYLHDQNHHKIQCR